MATRILLPSTLFSFIVVVSGGCTPAPTPLKSNSVPGERASSPYGEFAFRVEPLLAIEGGPIILKVVYERWGTSPLTISRPAGTDDLEVVPPHGWRTLDGDGACAIIGSLPAQNLAPPKDEFVGYCAVHQQFSGIGEGVHEVTLRWHVRLADNKETEIVVVQQSQKISVHKATEKSLKQFREIFWGETAVKGGDRRAGMLAKALGEANDPLVLRLRFDLLDDPRTPESARDWLVSDISRYRGLEEIRPVEEQNVRNAVCDYLERPYPNHGARVVNKMVSNSAPRGFNDAVKPRLDHLHPLVRSTCFASFSDLLSEKQKDKLIADLSRLYPIPEPAAIQSQVRRLDADAFRDRENATAELRKLGLQALESLKAEAAKPRSAESAARLKQLIDDIQKADRPENLPLEVETLKHLKDAKNERADAAIAAIASNKGDAWIVREARSIRGQRK